MIHDSGDSPPTFYGTSYGRDSRGDRGGTLAKGTTDGFMVVDGYARATVWGRTKTSSRNLTAGELWRRKEGAASIDEERGRAFIGFDDCTVSRGIDERKREERKRG